MRRLFLSIVSVLLTGMLAGRALGASQPNIIVVTMESVRTDRMGFLGARGGLTPNFDALAKRAIVFERAYAQTPTTVVSHATILSGTYPQTHQASELGDPLAQTVPFLPELLRARGYRTAAFVGSVELDPRSGLAQGFDRGFEIYDAGFTGPGEVSPGVPSMRPGAQVAARALKWISESSKQPFFLWIHLADASGLSAATYNRGIGSDDAALGQIISALRNKNLMENSVLAVASDHGESLGAHGEDSHGIFLYDETIRVPLVIKMPQDQLAGKRVKGRVRLIDLAPTLLEAAGVPVPSQMQGQSLLRVAKTNPDADQPVYSRSTFPRDAFGLSMLESWRTGKYLYIRAPKPELYDVVADPGATRNLAENSKATMATLASMVESFDSRFDGSGNKQPAGLTSSEVQKLASLGYVGIQKSAQPSTSAPTGTDPKDAISGVNQVMTALANLRSAKPERSAAVLPQAVAAQPNAYLAHYVLGSALASQRNLKGAVEQFRRAIELRPQATWAHYQMGATLVKLGDWKTAVVHLELASSRVPQFKNVHLLLAECYEHLGQAQQAQSERSKASK